MQSFFVKCDHKYVRVGIEDILYIESIDNYIKIHTKKKVYLVLMRLKHIEELLPAEQFCRIHRSYLVATEHINCFDNDEVQVGETYLPLGRLFRPELKRKVQVIMPSPTILK